jgi:hypothetical protein
LSGIAAGNPIHRFGESTANQFIFLSKGLRMTPGRLRLA